jgi:hypothetical protein
MKPQFTLQVPSQAEIEQSINEAHQIRSEYISGLVGAGVAKLRGLFSHKPSLGKHATES